MRRITLYLVGFVVAISSAPVAAHAAAAPSPSDSPAPAVVWSMEPANAQGPDGRVSIRTEIAPGASDSDHIVLTNLSTEPATFHVYSSDGIVTPDGNFDILPPDAIPQDGGSWVRFSPVGTSAVAADRGLTARLTPQESVVIPLAISVPDNATPGDHPLGIVAEYVPDTVSDLQTATRIGVRVHLRVSGDLVTSLSPEDATASWTPEWNPFAPGSVTVRYQTTNSGNIRLGASSAVSVAGPFGIGTTTATATHREILPGGVVEDEIRMPAWPLILGQGTIVITPSLVGDDEGPSSIPAVTTTFTVWTIPWAQLALLLVIAVIVLAIIGSRRRGRKRIQERIDAAVAQATKELQSGPERADLAERS